MSVDELLAPVSPDAPAGADLYDDPERQEIEIAFDGDPSEVDWRHVIGLIEGQCGRTKDAWLGVYLARAGALSGRLDVVARGCELLAGLFETYWTDMHPSLEEYGFQGRKGPCESLVRIGPFLGPLRRVRLVEHPRLGVYTGEDLERFAAEGTSADGYGMFRKAVEDVDAEELRGVVDRLDAMHGAIRRTDAVLVANGDGDTGTDFTPTYQAIAAIRGALAPFAGLTGEAAADTSSAEPEDAAEPARAGSADTAPRIAGRVDSREDVVRALDGVIDYYRRREPTSPVPVALQRVQAWVFMDFMSLLRDIAPGGLSEVETILLARPAEGESSGY